MNDTHEIELSLTQAKKIVERKAMVAKLMGNREFKALILEGYFKEEPARLVNLLGDPSLQAHREAIVMDMHGIAALQGYFRNVERMGTLAEITVADHEAELESIAASEADEATE